MANLLSFVRWLACPVTIVKPLTDKGSQLTDRFTGTRKAPETGDRIPTGQHVFDVLCKQLAIKDRLVPTRHPQSNGMVERFNGRISEIVNQARFGSRAELESTLRNYLKIDNHNSPQGGLDNATSIQAMKKWQEKKPPLFVKRIYKQARLDSYTKTGNIPAPLAAPVMRRPCAPPERQSSNYRATAPC